MHIAVILLPQTAIRRAASGRLGTRRPEISAPKGRSAGSATAALARILFACRIVPRPSGVGPMRDYYPFVTRIVAGLDSNTGESRRVLYGRARAALCEQLRGVSPPLTDSEITRERLSLEAAIRRFEAEAIRRPRGTPMDATTAAAGRRRTSRPSRASSGGTSSTAKRRPSATSSSSWRCWPKWSRRGNRRSASPSQSRGQRRAAGSSMCRRSTAGARGSASPRPRGFSR